MMLAEGDTIGRYRVVRLLGTGGMGTVYEVERMDGGGRYALKAFTRDHGDVESLRRRFQTEGKALQLLRHPNLLRVYELDEDVASGSLYFVMDLVLDANGAARTLADVESGDVDEAQLARWYGQLKSALDYIHAEGVVHRDVKPSNVLINADGDSILGDFGISRFTDGDLRRKLDAETTMESVDADARTVMGSVMYLAPEVQRGERATPSADASTWSGASGIVGSANTMSQSSPFPSVTATPSTSAISAPLFGPSTIFSRKFITLFTIHYYLLPTT